MQQRHAALEVEARFARVTWIEIPNAADGLVERFVRVAKHNRVRLLLLHPVGQQYRGRVRLHDVLQQKLVPAQFEHLDVLQRQT